jgi:hypothetical protein
MWSEAGAEWGCGGWLSAVARQSLEVCSALAELRLALGVGKNSQRDS